MSDFDYNIGAMIPDELKGILSQNPNIMSGAICFSGTRVPVIALLDNHRHGGPMAEFMEDYPDLSSEQIQAVLDWQDKQTKSILGIE